MNQWQNKIIDLKKKGFTQTEIAAQVGCSQNYISNLENGLCGKRLSYEYAKKLNALWEKHCSEN